MTIGDNLKKIRKEKKLTQQQLAEKMNISRSYLSDVENNRYNPSSKTIESFAEKLGVTMFYLTTGDKALADLTDDERKEAFQGVQDILKEHKEVMQSTFKKDIESILSSELSITEITYLTNMISFLKVSDTQDIIGLSSIIATLLDIVAYKSANVVDKDELNSFLKSELDSITKFFREYLFKDSD